MIVNKKINHLKVNNKEKTTHLAEWSLIVDKHMSIIAWKLSFVTARACLFNYS